MIEVQQVRTKDLKWYEKTYLPQIAGGLMTTLKQLFRPKFTRQFPEEKWTPPPSFRGRPVLATENGVERCVACGLCSRVCPSLAIEVQAAETHSLEKERYPQKFEINMVRCIFCGFCEEVCPEEAIIMSDEYILTFSSQKEAIFGKDKLLMDVSRLRKRLEFLHENV